MALDPIRVNRNLRFGTAIHAGLEVWYDPAMWEGDRYAVQAMSLLAFVKAYPYDGIEGDVEQMDAWEADLVLGKGMLEGYFKWALEHDTFTPISVEQEFEVELPLEDASYAGRLDLLVRDQHGDYWILDHKTAARLEDESFLVLDQQITSYCWAMQHVLNIPIAGFIYNELRKDVPHPPELLKNGRLSQNKNQNTTYELYLDKINELGQSVNSYAGILEHLQSQGNKFFRRTYVQRSPRELEIAGEMILLEATDMLSNPSIYPNPGKHCTWCDFRSPCLARMDGSDTNWILESNYVKKGD